VIDGPFSIIVIITKVCIRLRLYRGTMAVYCKRKFEHINRMHGQDIGCSNVQTCGMQNFHWICEVYKDSKGRGRVPVVKVLLYRESTFETV
jgi:hypothetical protein